MVSPISPFRATATLPLQTPSPEGPEPRGRSFAGTVAPAHRSQDLAALPHLMRAVLISLKTGLPKCAQHAREVTAALRTTAKLTRPKPTPEQARAAVNEARKVFEKNLTSRLSDKGLTQGEASSAARQIAEHFGAMNTVEKLIRSLPAVVGWGTITAPVVDPAIDFALDRVLDLFRSPQPEPAKR